MCSCDLMLRQQKLADLLHLRGCDALELQLQPQDGITEGERLDKLEARRKEVSRKSHISMQDIRKWCITAETRTAALTNPCLLW